MSLIISSYFTIPLHVNFKLTAGMQNFLATGIQCFRNASFLWNTSILLLLCLILLYLGASLLKQEYV